MDERSLAMYHVSFLLSRFTPVASMDMFSSLRTAPMSISSAPTCAMLQGSAGIECSTLCGILVEVVSNRLYANLSSVNKTDRHRRFY